MAKILISFLGTGPLTRDGNAQRMYRPAKYKLGDSTMECTFVAKMLAQKENADKIFLIGTPHSMWEEVYASFSGTNKDDNKWLEIGDYCDNANKDSDLIIPHKNDVEAALGPESKVILVHYGLNDAEIKENLEIVLSIIKDLKPRDEIVVDITHSFRSLPLIIMNLLFYLRTVNNPKVTISHIYYGMLEVSRDLGYAPIIDLKQVLDVTDWTIGAYAFREFGISQQICELINCSNKDLEGHLERFSTLLSLNYLGPLQQESQRLSSLKNYEYDSLFQSLTIKPVIEDFIKTFAKEDKPYRFQYNLAKWQFEKFNLLASMTTLLEATITYACSTNAGIIIPEIHKKLDWKDKDSRDFCKKMLQSKNNNATARKSFYVDQTLKDIYRSINNKRNNLVHQTVQTNSSADEYVKAIEENLKAFGKLITESH